MKKNYTRYYNSLFSVMPNEQSQVEKFLALEDHPRQKQQRSLSTLGHILATTTLMY